MGPQIEFPDPSFGGPLRGAHTLFRNHSKLPAIVLVARMYIYTFGVCGVRGHVHMYVGVNTRACDHLYALTAEHIHAAYGTFHLCFIASHQISPTSISICWGNK